MKKGSLVKVIEDGSSHSYKKGDIVRIEEINGSIAPYRCSRIEDGLQQWVNEQDIELVKYTWEDFLKAPIGTKVTFEYGMFVKYNETSNQFVSKNFYLFYRDYEDFKDFEDKVLGKIVKVEKPTYTTVYESKEIVMTEIEEMTLEEVCKELGREIKIVKEK